jgi:hypothetical protein
MSITNVRRLLAILLAIGVLSAACTDKEPEDPTADTAILVLDQFKPKPEGPVTSEPSSRQPNCGYTGIAANEVGSGGGGNGLPNGVSHGQAVFETVRDDLNGRSGLLAVASPAAIDHPLVVKGSVSAWSLNGKTMLLVGVEIQDYDTSLLSAKLKEVMDKISEGYGIKRFVLNMSFVVAPCDINAWFEAAGQPLTTTALLDSYQAIVNGVDALNHLRSTLESFVKENSGKNANQVILALPAEARDGTLVNLFHRQLIVEVGQQDRWPPDAKGYDQAAGDPLKAGINDLQQSGSYRVIPVGASGNGVYLPGTDQGTAQRVRPDFPFAPALWNVVVSAGAGKDTVRAEYSNGAEVMLEPANRYGAQGTSFAAPHLAAMEAFYLMGGGPVVCPDTDRNNHIPPLGYTDSDVRAKPVWANLWLSATPGSGDPALPKCKDFQHNIPVPSPTP